ncbi:MAG TPA: hypothetical protein VGM17_17705, partial [Rhizomicrobium sp.]
MPEYREYVASKADGQMPSDIFLNRNAAHAAIVVEFIFRKAERHVRLVTNRLSADVYGTPEVISAADGFLRRHPDATLEILAETNIDRAASPFLAALDGAGFAARVFLRFIPTTTTRAYKFNFAVADGQHYRFEESRTSREAIVQFGAPDFGVRLEGAFADLSIAAADSIT